MGTNLKEVPQPEIAEDEKRYVGMGKSGGLITAKRSSTLAKSEPQMRALRRVLGDDVLLIIPEGIREAVDESFEIWKTNPDSYLPTQFDSPADRDNALLVMRAYAEMANGDGYTIRTIPSDDPCQLIWRAQTRIQRGQS